MSKIGLIIEREYLSRVYKKSFIIMTLVTPLIFIAFAVVPALLAQIKDTDTKEVAVIDHTGKYASLLKGNETYRFVPVKESAEAPLDYYKSQGDGLYAILTISGDLLQDPNQITLFSEKTINMGLENLITSQLDDYLTDEKINSYNIPDLKRIIDNSRVSLKLQTVKWNPEGEETSSSADAAAGIGLGATLLIYIFIFAYGGMVMQGVMQEKTNRIVEVMVSSVKPFELMMGKIIGVGLVGLTQFMIWMVLLGGVALSVGIGLGVGSGLSSVVNTDMSALGAIDPSITSADQSAFMTEIQGMIGGINFAQLIGFFVLYFIGGYLLYASIFAAIGSMVDQEADTQQFMIPVTMIILFAFYAAIYSIENPDGPLAFWCSLIPFSSPIVMMVRLPYDVPVWQMILSIGLLFGTFILTTYFAAKIYRTGILMYGKKISYKEMIKWLKY
ncbi:MAG: ABC transporter permease [Bacteroidales bacterium]